MTVTDIVNAISIKLYDTFGNRYKIYSEEVLQGLSEPCFFITIVSSSREQIVGSRYFESNYFDIHYFPENETAFDEMRDISDRLYAALEFITLLDGDLIHGTKMRYEIVDSVLHFYVNFDVFLIKHTEKEIMQDADINVSI